MVSGLYNFFSCSPQLRLKFVLRLNDCWRSNIYKQDKLVFGGLNQKMKLILAILVFMNRVNFKLSLVEHENIFITCGPGLLKSKKRKNVHRKKLHWLLNVFFMLNSAENEI